MRLFRIVVGCWLFIAATSLAHGGLINPSFEVPRFSPGVPSVDFPSAAAVPGWNTTDPGGIEVWSDGFLGVVSFDADQHVELNAFIAGTLFQDASGIPAGVQVGWEFAHRARASNSESMRLTITDLGANNAAGGGDDTVLFTDIFVGNTAFWQFHDSSLRPPIFALGNDVRFAYTAVFPGGSVGNFIDAADFGIGVGGAPAAPVPEPASLAIWSLLGLGAAVHGLRRRRELWRA